VSKPLLSGVVIAVAFLVAGGVYLAAPALISGQARVDTEVRDHVERARRLLAKVSQNKERLAMVLEALRAAGVEDLDDERLAELVEQDRELLDDARDRLQEVLRRRDPQRQALEAQLGEVGGVPLVPPPRDFGRNVGQMVQAIREGLNARQRILAENARLLDEALAAIQEGLNVQHGDASGRQDPAALNMQGVILYAQGCALHRQARPLRDQAHKPRRELLAVSAELALLDGEQQFVADSNMDTAIRQAREDLAGRTTGLDELNAQVASLSSKITDLDARLAEQQTVADEARRALDALVDKGPDLNDPQGFDKFAAEYGAQSLLYREALRQAQILEFGTLANAKIDESGDFISGRYTPVAGSERISPQPGLYHCRAELGDLQARAEQTGQMLAALGSQVEVLEASKARLARQAAEAAARAAELQTRAADAYESMTDLLDRAESLESEAIAKLDAAFRAFNGAAAQIQSQQAEASEAVAALSQEASERSARAAFSSNRWPAASDRARAADAKLRLAMIHYDRYRDLTADSGILAGLPDALEIEADPEDLSEQAEEAGTEGFAAAEEAIDILYRASRDLNQHFSVAAEIASAYYLQSLFGRPDRVAAAIENYQAAVEGREDNPAVRRYVERLDQIRKQTTP